ncbi:MAG: acylphosphatase, partial [Proteobacteria bacterium]|nr:acylphosphatase [Pseudomonadota bacterium]
VEALFAGPAAAVDAMLEACRRGPSSAQVARVRAQPADAPPDGAGFRFRPTA